MPSVDMARLPPLARGTAELVVGTETAFLAVFWPFLPPAGSRGHPSFSFLVPGTSV